MKNVVKTTTKTSIIYINGQQKPLGINKRLNGTQQQQQMKWHEIQLTKEMKKNKNKKKINDESTKRKSLNIYLLLLMDTC